MTRIAVITKSFAPDFELCVALNRSVLDNAPDTVQHHIIAAVRSTRAHFWGCRRQSHRTRTTSRPSLHGTR
jgi:hypothetical protein